MLLYDFERYPVVGLHSIAHLLPSARSRCGIYILVFRNGDHYVGQAVDVAARFGAHRRTYPGDIVEIAFRRLPRRRLDIEERAQIAHLHRAGVPLRNVVHTPGRVDAADFDTLVTPDEQVRWLASPEVTSEPRPDQPELRHRHRHRFDRLASDPRLPGLTRLLGQYVTRTIPFPARTELAYWSLSAVPSTNASTYPRLFTLAVQTLETLFVYTTTAEPQRLMVNINVDLPTLIDACGSLDRLMDRFPGLDAYRPDYRARPAVAALSTSSPGQAIQLLRVRGVAAAARRLNLDLMRKGPTMHWRTHCFDLADYAWDHPPPRRPGQASQ